MDCIGKILKHSSQNANFAIFHVLYNYMCYARTDGQQLRTQKIFMAPLRAVVIGVLVAEEWVTSEKNFSGM